MADAQCRPGWMISVDDHVPEPPGVRQDRVPARYTRLKYSGTTGDVDRVLVERDEELYVDPRPPTQIFKGADIHLLLLRLRRREDHERSRRDRQHADRDGLPGLTDEQKWKVLAGNAMRIHNFKPAYPAPAA